LQSGQKVFEGVVLVRERLHQTAKFEGFWKEGGRKVETGGEKERREGGREGRRMRLSYKYFF